jgi:hypothetical protein
MGFFSELRSNHRAHEAALERWDTIRSGFPAVPETFAANELTICSVAYKSRQCLDLNHRLLRGVNPEGPVPTWLLFDNNDDARERIDGRDGRFTVVRPDQRMGFMGYEHALGLLALLAEVKTRFVLFLDPDCFVVRPHWVSGVMSHMIERELTFFGTPINPRRHNSYRYFPYCVCMFVDLARIPRRELALLPGVWDMRAALEYRLRGVLPSVPRVGALFRWLLTEQWRTNGWQLRQRYAEHATIRNECVQPVWNIEEAIPSGSVRRLVHTMTPGSVSPIPKRPGYTSPIGFREMGAPDVDALGWEEFVWHNEPFAFHIGSVHFKNVPYDTTLPALCDEFARRAQPASAGASAAFETQEARYR